LFSVHNDWLFSLTVAFGTVALDVIDCPRTTGATGELRFSETAAVIAAA
jgi:hypothetical protein